MLSPTHAPICLSRSEQERRPPDDDPTEWPWSRVPKSELFDEGSDLRSNTTIPAPLVVAGLVLLLGLGCLLW